MFALSVEISCGVGGYKVISGAQVEERERNKSYDFESITSI